MRRRPGTWLLAATGIASWALWSTPAVAEPQYNASLVTGVAGLGEGALWQQTCWWNALHADVLLGRDRSSDLGIGPYVEAGTAGFSDGRFGGGLSLLLPVHPFVPAIVSAGGYGRYTEPYGLEPGLEANLFLGSRSYNFHSNYSIGAGFVAGFKYGLGDSKERTVVLALQIDGALMALPFVLLYQSLKSSPQDRSDLDPEDR